MAKRTAREWRHLWGVALLVVIVGMWVASSNLARVCAVAIGGMGCIFNNLYLTHGLTKKYFFLK
jgi:hypothetical protein